LRSFRPQSGKKLHIMKEIEDYSHDDKLKLYFNSKGREEAPPDFTAQLMKKISQEKHVGVQKTAIQLRFIPVASALITVLLSLLLITLPTGNNASQELLLNKISEIFVLRVLDLSSIHITIPDISPAAIWFISGLIILFVLDRLLFRLFCR